MIWASSRCLYNSTVRQFFKAILEIIMVIVATIQLQKNTIFLEYMYILEWELQGITYRVAIVPHPIPQVPKMYAT